MRTRSSPSSPWRSPPLSPSRGRRRIWCQSRTPRAPGAPLPAAAKLPLQVCLTPVRRRVDAVPGAELSLLAGLPVERPAPGVQLRTARDGIFVAVRFRPLRIPRLLDRVPSLQPLPEGVDPALDPDGREAQPGGVDPIAVVVGQVGPLAGTVGRPVVVRPGPLRGPLPGPVASLRLAAAVPVPNVVPDVVPARAAAASASGPATRRASPSGRRGRRWTSSPPPGGHEREGGAPQSRGPARRSRSR